jgi:hypothetical protein
MQLDLVDRGHDSGLADQALEVGDLEVGDADRLGAAGLLDLLQGRPRSRHRGWRAGSAKWIRKRSTYCSWRRFRLSSKALKVFLAPWRSFHSLVAMKQLLARHLGGADAGADAFLVAVDRGGVDRAVTGVDRGLHHLGRVPVLDLPDAEAELGNIDAIVQANMRLLSHCLFSELWEGSRK